MAHPGIYLVSLQVQKEGERLKKEKSTGKQNKEGGIAIYLAKVCLQTSPIPLVFSPAVALKASAA